MNKKFITYTFRVYPNSSQKKLINHTFIVCKEIYNLMLKERAYIYNKYILYTERCLINKLEIDEERFFCHNLPQKAKEIKRKNSRYMNIDDSTIYYEQLAVIDAYDKYFAGVSGFPRYKNDNSKLIYKTNNIKVKEGKLQIPYVGTLKANINKKIPTNCIIKNATIKQNKNDTYYVSLLLEFKNNYVLV